MRRRGCDLHLAHPRGSDAGERAVALDCVRQSAQGRGVERGADRRTIAQPRPHRREEGSLSRAAGVGPKLLVTGFGPFPGAPENPTDPLVRALAQAPAERFRATAFRAVVLPTEYRRSWSILSRLYAGYAPDVVVHFGLSG